MSPAAEEGSRGDLRFGTIPGLLARSAATWPDAVAIEDGEESLDQNDFPSMDEIEKQHIIRALDQAQQNRTKAAKLLGMNVRTLRNKINTYRESAVSDADLAKLGETD